MIYSRVITFPAAINAIATSRIDSNTLWVALADGTLQRASNASAGASVTWTPITVTSNPPSGVTSVTVDAENTSVVVAVYASFCNCIGASTRHVFLTKDNGQTWQDISGVGGRLDSLPDLPLNAVAIDPDTSPHTSLVAGDGAVLRIVNLDQTWEMLGVGVPTSEVTSLQIDNIVSPPVLRVSTFGRSAFELKTASSGLLAVNADPSFGKVVAGANDTRVIQLFNLGTAPLHVNSLVRASGDSVFQTISGPPTPMTLLPGKRLISRFASNPLSIRTTRTHSKCSHRAIKISPARRVHVVPTCNGAGDRPARSMARAPMVPARAGAGRRIAMIQPGTLSSTVRNSCNGQEA